MTRLPKVALAWFVVGLGPLTIALALDVAADGQAYCPTSSLRPSSAKASFMLQKHFLSSHQQASSLGEPDGGPSFVQTLEFSVKTRAWTSAAVELLWGTRITGGAQLTAESGDTYRVAGFGGSTPRAAGPGQWFAWTLTAVLPVVCFFILNKVSFANPLQSAPPAVADDVGEGAADNASAAEEKQMLKMLGSIAVIVYVCLLVGVDTLASFISQNSGGAYPWEPASVVLLVEATKCIVSIALLGAGRSNDVPTPSTRCLLGAALRLLPVAMLYAGNNCLVLYVLSKIQLSSFVVWRNSSIVFNAIIWVARFQQPLSQLKCTGISCLLLGLVLSDIEGNGSVGALDHRVLLVLLSALSSSIASVGTESVLKGPFGTEKMSINYINAMMYAETSTMLIFALAFQHGGNLVDAFRNLDHLAAALVTGQAMLGLVVSRVLVYTDSVTKVMAGGVREVATLLIAPMFVTSRSDWTSRVAGMYVFLAGIAYFLPPQKNVPKASDGGNQS